MRRRTYLATAASTISLAAAGCSSSDEPADSPPEETDTTAETGGTADTTAAETPTFDSVSEIKAQAQVVPYDELFRNIDQYKNEAVYYEFAQVYQTIYNEEGDYLRLNVSTTEDEWQGDVTAWWYGDGRLLEDDRVELWAVVNGLDEYETTQGDVRTTPELLIADYELREGES